MDYQSKDKYPYNIEAAQKLYFQYSEDIDFVYDGSNYPLGEEHEGFIWEEVYNPVKHLVGDTEIGRHVWMRLSIGDKTEWTLPIRITDSISNITSTEGVVNESTGEVSFTIKYTLDTGEVIESEPIILKNGTDGIGISNSQIVNDNLVITYSNGTVVDLGRVTGYDGSGVPFGSPDDYYLTNQSNIPVWTDPTPILNSTLTATFPLEYTEPNFTHSDVDGNRHIPIGGDINDSLITDGSGNYSWLQNIPLSSLDDTAGLGDLTLLWSADKIQTMFNALSTFGIKYAVDFIADLSGLIGMTSEDLCVVNEDRGVYKYDGANWNYFFALDGIHNHDDRYYTEVELNTSGAGGFVHWDNITNKDIYFNINGNNGSAIVNNGDTFDIIGDFGINVNVIDGLNLITISGTEYTAGIGLNLTSTEFSHADTSSLPNTSNTGGVVLNNIEVDEFGHLENVGTINLDSRYAQLLTRGLGLTGNNYNGSISTTWNVDYGGSGGYFGSANTVARSDHSHTSGTVGNFVNISYYSGWGPNGISYMKTRDLGNGLIELIGVALQSGSNLTIGTITLNHRPDNNMSHSCLYMSPTYQSSVTGISISINGNITLTAPSPVALNGTVNIYLIYKK